MAQLISSSLSLFESREDPVNDVNRFKKNKLRNFEQTDVKMHAAKNIAREKIFQFECC